MLKDYIKENRTVRDSTKTQKFPPRLMDMIDWCQTVILRHEPAALKYFIANRIPAAAILPKRDQDGRTPSARLPDAGKEPESYIVILQDPEISTSDTFTNIDLGIAAQSITLAAVEKGYRCCMLEAAIIPEEPGTNWTFRINTSSSWSSLSANPQKKFTW